MPVTTTTIYGSKSYEDNILSQFPLAVFGPYNSSNNSMTDMTNRNWLSASIAGSGYYDQIPFFALAGLNYTFNINPSTKIIITENTNLFPNALGKGSFSQGDEKKDFSIEFLLSNNYSHYPESNTSFAKFGIYNSQANMDMSYNGSTNQFYFNIYSIDGYIRYRSVISEIPEKISKHVVLSFIKGNPSFYINGNKGNVLINELNSNIFFSPRVTNRVVAEFCSSSTTNFLVSMISFYEYSFNDENVINHYKYLYDLEDYDSNISTYGSPILNETITPNEINSRNDGYSQNFYGSNILNISTDPIITVNKTSNFSLFGIDNQYDYAINYSGSYGSSSIGGMSLMSTDYGDKLISNKLSLVFSGLGSGMYTSENSLMFVENSTVGDFYVSIDSSSSKVYIGSGSNTVLASMSSSVSQKPSKQLDITFSGSTIFVKFSDNSDSASYNFGSDISASNANLYLFNRYYYNSSGVYVSGGNNQFDFGVTYANNASSVFAGLNKPYLDSSSILKFSMYQYTTGIANIIMPVPSIAQNYFYSNDSGNIKYSLNIDGIETSITNESVINIPTTSSYCFINASLSIYYNDKLYDSSIPTYIKNIYMYNFDTASYSKGSYPVSMDVSNGVLSNMNSYPNVFKQNNIGFFQSASNTISINQANTKDYIELGQIDFLIAIPELNSFSSSLQYLIDNRPSSSMALTYLSGSYILNFYGMSASINGLSATSGSTKLQERNHYFIQSSLNTPASSSTFIYLFSASNGTSPFVHSFDKVSVFSSSTTNTQDRFGNIFGRKTILVSDNNNDYLRVQSVPDNTNLVNKSWQIYLV